MWLSDVLYAAYARRLARQLDTASRPPPRRRHARRQPALGQGPRRRDAATGTRPAPTRSTNLLAWCDEVGVEVVTLWLLSTDNLTRPEKELRPLLRHHRGGRRRRSPRPHRWRLHPVGALDLLPAATARAAQGGRGPHPRRRRDARQRRRRLRRPARDRRRGALAAAGARRPGHAASRSSPRCLDVEHIAEHLYTKGQPDPDLVIRTSGEQRLGGFLLWQSAHSEFYFCEAYWPDFRKVDFLRALRAYAARHRRFGA